MGKAIFEENKEKAMHIISIAKSLARTSPNRNIKKLANAICDYSIRIQLEANRSIKFEEQLEKKEEHERKMAEMASKMEEMAKKREEYYRKLRHKIG